MSYAPGYLSLHEKGILEKRLQQAREIMQCCTLCPHQCRLNRLEGRLGKCAAGKEALVASYGPHFGEEAPLVGSRGSGTIFFASCNLKCVYCQNFEISHFREGQPVQPKQLARIMLELQRKGCHNINLVSPTHFVPPILEALQQACRQGLNLPLVYNCGGYEALETLKILDGIIDIYMPDLKYASSDTAFRYSGASDYPRRAREALKEMYRQVGNLKCVDGIAFRGLLVRHLVLPGNLAGTAGLMKFLARDISPDVFLNLMNQYRPAYQAYQHPPLDRPLTLKEYQKALARAREAGLQPRG